MEEATTPRDRFCLYVGDKNNGRTISLIDLIHNRDHISELLARMVSVLKSAEKSAPEDIVIIITRLWLEILEAVVHINACLKDYHLALPTNSRGELRFPPMCRVQVGRRRMCLRTMQYPWTIVSCLGSSNLVLIAR